jgi:Sec-independent protein translocase protein TatA
MEVFGIGPLELLFILLIALIILGPGDMVKAGLTLGRFLRKIITSPEWRTVQKASRELRYLPNRLMREASLDELSNELKDINSIGRQINNEVKKELDMSTWTTPPGSTNLPITRTDPEESKTIIGETSGKVNHPNNDN